jgi:hypothetical protein
MLKQISQLEHIIENRPFRFICDHDAPIHFVKEALFQMQKYIGQVEDYAKAQQAQQVSENKVEPIDEVKADVQS